VPEVWLEVWVKNNRSFVDTLNWLRKRNFSFALTEISVVSDDSYCLQAFG